MNKYVKRQEVIRGVVFNGSDASDRAFLEAMQRPRPLVAAVQFDGTEVSARSIAMWANREGLIVKRLETDEGLKLAVFNPDGVAIAHGGDWVVKEQRGEFYPYKPNIFEATYEELETIDAMDYPQCSMESPPNEPVPQS